LRVVPQNNAIYLSSGWNLLPYLRNSNIPVLTAFQNIISSVKLVKDNFGNVFCPAFNLNQINEMQLGKGYLIYLLNLEIFNYPNN